MEDGTSAIQNITGIEVDTCKLHIKPYLLDNMNLKVNKFHISKQKPVLCLVEKKHEERNTVLFKNYLSAGYILDTLSYSKEGRNIV